MQPSRLSPTTVRFGLFEVDLAASELRKRGRKIPLQDQPFKVLALLLRSPGELVTREELQRALWPDDTFGDFDEGLNKAIQKIRQALDDSTEKPQFIETVPRKGYRFIAAVDSAANGASTPVVPDSPKRRNREVVAWALAAILSLALVLLAAAYFRPRPSETHAVRFQIPPSERVLQSHSDRLAASPDGHHLAITGRYLGGGPRIWIRSFDSFALQELQDTEGAYFPFWSADSRFVGFFRGDKLEKIDIVRGPPTVLCEAPILFGGTGGTWSQDGTILFSSTAGVLHRVSATGGEPTVALSLDKSRKEIGQSWPHFLPDGRHFVYLSQSSDTARSGIYLASLESKETRRLLLAESNVAYAPPGFLIFGQRETLMAQPFDARNLQIVGDPFPIAERVGATDGPGSLFSVSDTGVLAYRAPDSSRTQLAWYNREGARLRSIGEPGDYEQIAMSPNEKRLAVERPDPVKAVTNIWILELSTGILSRLTFSDEQDPVWSPDGLEVLYMSHRGDRWGLYRKVVGGDETLIFDSGEELYSENWLPGGKSIVIIDQGGRAFFQLPLSAGSKPVAFLKSEFSKDEPHVSPDGRWIAYNTTESGRWEVYVAAFPNLSGKRQVSNNGGAQALWRRDGKELFYLSLDGKLMAVDVKAGVTIETGVPKALFQTPLVVSPVDDQYCVTADGRRFLIGEPVGDTAKPITVVLNWTAGLKR